jgi:hypothetical protein
MKKVKKVVILVFLGLLFCSVLVSCSNAVVRPSAGVNVVWGRHGPKVVPSIGVNVYGGGRY